MEKMLSDRGKMNNCMASTAPQAQKVRQRLPKHCFTTQWTRRSIEWPRLEGSSIRASSEKGGKWGDGRSTYFPRWGLPWSSQFLHPKNQKGFMLPLSTCRVYLQSPRSVGRRSSGRGFLLSRSSKQMLTFLSNWKPKIAQVIPQAPSQAPCSTQEMVAREGCPQTAHRAQQPHSLPLQV